MMGNPMLKPMDPSRFLPIAVAGWMNQQQQFAIDYLREVLQCAELYWCTLRLAI
jgi:hypothetical protein